jgi:hypothetical protein
MGIHSGAPGALGRKIDEPEFRARRGAIAR